MFSKRHYEWLAKFAHEVPMHSRRKLANALKRDFPNFDYERFLVAAEIRTYNEQLKEQN